MACFSAVLTLILEIFSYKKGFIMILKNLNVIYYIKEQLTSPFLFWWIFMKKYNISVENLQCVALFRLKLYTWIGIRYCGVFHV